MRSQPRHRFIVFSTLSYVLFASLWLIFSDRLLTAFSDPQTIVGLSTAKGMVFVIVTASLLYLALLTVPDSLTGHSLPDIEHSAKPGAFRWARSLQLPAYACALFTSLLVLWMRGELEPLSHGRPLLILFMFPIILSAILGGAGPGMLATLISAIGVRLFGFMPLSQFALSDTADIFQWWALVVNGILVSLLSETMHRAYARVARQHARLSLGAKQLNASEQRLHLAQDAARAGTWEWNLDNNNNYWSDEVWALYGLAAQSCPPTYAGWLQTVHPDDRPNIQKAVNSAAAQGVEFETTWQVNTPEGSPPRWLLSRGRPIKDEHGKIARYLGIVIDVSERVLAEQVAERERIRLQTILRMASDGIHILDGKGYLLEASQAFWSMLGDGNAVKTPLHVSDWDAHFSHKEIEDLLARLLASDAPLTFETCHQRQDGTLIDVEVAACAIHVDGQTLIYASSRDITERKRNALELEAHRHHLEELVAAKTSELRIANQVLATQTSEVADLYNHAPCGYHCLDQDGRFVSINDTELAWLGYSRDEVLGKLRYTDVIAPHSVAHFTKNFQHLQQVGHVEDLEYDLLRKDGSLLPVLFNATAVYDAQGNFLQSRTTLFDITERKRVAEQLCIAAVAFQSRDGMLVTDSHGVILQVNQAFTEMAGYSAEEVVGHTPAMLHSGVHDADYYRNIWEAARSEGRWQGNIWNRRKDGDVYLKWLSISAVRDAAGAITHYVGEYAEVSEPREAERKILELAFYDPLTGLPNRRLLHDRLYQTLAGSSRNAQYSALLLLDLDHFKTLNDTRGHDVGDQLLIEVGRRLRANLREADTAARLGGDEFVVLLGNLGDRDIFAAEGAEAIADKLRCLLAAPFLLQGTPCHITVSIGITLLHDASESPESLLKQADLALYQAKDAGRNVGRFYTPALLAAVETRADMEAGLRRALAEDELVLYYQPQVNSDGQLIGVEALLRWLPPGKPMIPPTEFIPIAEHSGLILPIGNWVLTAACRQIAAWSASPATRDLRVAVNISAHQFRQPDFIAYVQAALQESGADPRRLKLELTESSVVDDMDNVIHIMHTLQAQGIGFSMDDFGTGYSSLANLKRLPIEQLKIDQSFVRDIPGDADDCAIARAVIALGQSLHLNVIAEGVETLAQRDFLASHGCRAYQGYLYGRPMPAAALTDLAQPREPVLPA